MRQAAAKRRLDETEHNGRVVIAWMTASLMRTKKIPKVEKLMIRQRSRKPQTQEEQLTIIRMWNAALGGDVVTNGKVH